MSKEPPRAPAPIFANAPLWFHLGAIADPTGRRVERISRAMLLYGEPGAPGVPSQLATALISRFGARSRHAADPEHDPQLAESIDMLCIYIRRLEDIARQVPALELRAAQHPSTNQNTQPTTNRETDRHGRQEQGPAHNHD